MRAAVRSPVEDSFVSILGLSSPGPPAIGTGLPASVAVLVALQVRLAVRLPVGAFVPVGAVIAVLRMSVVAVLGWPEAVTGDGIVATVVEPVSVTELRRPIAIGPAVMVAVVDVVAVAIVVAVMVMVPVLRQRNSAHSDA